MFRWYGNVGGAASVGLLVLRLAVGTAFLFHGWPKIQNATTWMDKMPDAPPPYLQAAAAVAEFGGGIALILGLLTPLFAVLLACTMAVAALKVHIPHGDPFVEPMGGRSWELAGVYFAAAIMFLLVGPGQLSLDHCLFGRRRSAAADLPPYSNR
jgi:putative oxidoreductase